MKRNAFRKVFMLAAALCLALLPALQGRAEAGISYRLELYHQDGRQLASLQMADGLSASDAFANDPAVFQPLGSLQLPPWEGRAFLHWYVDGGNQDTAYSLSHPITGNVRLRALFADAAPGAEEARPRLDEDSEPAEVLDEAADIQHEGGETAEEGSSQAEESADVVVEAAVDEPLPPADQLAGPAEVEAPQPESEQPAEPAKEAAQPDETPEAAPVRASEEAAEPVLEATQPEDAEETLTDVDAAQPEAPSGMVVPVGDLAIGSTQLYLYAAPDMEAERLQRLQPATLVTVLSQDEAWALVSLPDGLQGYVPLINLVVQQPVFDLSQLAIRIWYEHEPEFVQDGDVLTMQGLLIGFDKLDMPYTTIWQYARMDENRLPVGPWTDIEGATGLRHTFTVNMENAQYTWRLIALVTLPEDGSQTP